MTNKVIGLIWINLIGTFTISAAAKPVTSRPIFRNSRRNDLRHFLPDFCHSHHFTCVIDLTSNAACPADSFDVLPEKGAVPAVLNTIIQKCPMYKWKVVEHIYVVEPKENSDTALNVLVGPVDAVMTAGALLHSLLEASHLPQPAGGESGLGLRAAGPWMVTHVVAKFILPHDTFKNTLLKAAKTIRPSIWVVGRKPSGTYEGDTDDYARPDEEKKR